MKGGERRRRGSGLIGEGGGEREVEEKVEVW